MKKYSWLIALVAIFALSFAGLVSCNDDDGDKTVSVTGVTLNETNKGLEVGDTLQLTPTVAPATATNKAVTWESSNSAIATVSNSGLVTAVAAGNATITVTTVDGDFKAECAITVSAGGAVRVESVSLDITSKSMEVGEKQQLTPTVLPANAANKAVTWESSAPTVATVDANGLVTAVAEGTALIVVTTVDGDFDADCEITVLPEGAIRVTSVSLDKDTLELVQGDTAQLTETVLPEDAEDKSGSWSSSNTAVATVSGTGLVTAIAEGTATITFTTTDGDFEADCEVTVEAFPIFADGSTTKLNLTALPYSSVSNIAAPAQISAYLLNAPDTHFLRVVINNTQAGGGSATVAFIGGDSPNRINIWARYRGSADSAPFVSYDIRTDTSGALAGRGHLDIPMSAVKANMTALGGNLRFQLASADRGIIEAMYLLPPCDSDCDLCATDCTNIPANAPCMCPGCFKDGPGTGSNVIPHNFCVCCIPAPIISITTQPANKTVSPGYTGETLTVAATINFPNDTVTNASLTYQWFSNATNSNADGTSIGGATNATFNIPVGRDVADGDIFYYVVVSATGASNSPVASNAAKFTVSKPTISITTQPAGKELEFEDYENETLTVVATLLYPDNPGDVLSFQWFSNATNANTGGTEIEDATTDTLEIADDLDIGDYFYYVVINAPGADEVTSSVAKIEVVGEIDPVKFSLASYITAQGNNFVDYESTTITGIPSEFLGTKNRISSSGSAYSPLGTSSGTDTTTLVLVNKTNNSLMLRQGSSTNNLNIRIGTTNGLGLDIVNRLYSIKIVGTGLATAGSFTLQYAGWTSNNSVASSGNVTEDGAILIEVNLPVTTTNPEAAADVLRITMAGPVHFIITELTITDLGPRE